jgi:hypothetical protein
MGTEKSKRAAAAGPVAFWFLNDHPDRPTMLKQVDELAARRFSAVVIHPRDGMEVLYLSQDWFELMVFLMDAAKERGLGVWFYDENPFPSGTAGGLLLDRHPELAGLSLKFERQVARPESGVLRAAFPAARRMVRVYAAEADESGARVGDFFDVTDHAGIVGRHWFVKGPCTHTYGPAFYPDEQSDEHWRGWVDREQWELQWRAPEDRPYLVLAVWQEPQADSRHGLYVDLLNPRTTEVFIEMTYQRTFDKLGAERFAQFQAAFTDEAKLCGPYPWSSGLVEDYQKAYGRDLRVDLPWLLVDAGLKGEAARLRYRRLLGRLWTERFCQPIGRWCESHGVPFTGHFSPEEDPLLQATLTPAWMQATAAMHWPGCDQISSRFGTLGDGYRLLGPKLASSVAHQHGREHVFTEALGVSGEGITLQRMRRILDCLAICGCDQFALHGQMMSMAGNRKREAPPSIFVQQPYWPFMGELSDHLARWTQWAGQGRPHRPIALLYPTSVIESRMPDDPEANEWARRLGRLVGRMMAAGLDFDLVSDVDLANSAMTRRDGQSFVVGQARYETLVVPEVPVLDEATAKAIQSLPLEGIEACVRLLGTEQVVRAKLASDADESTLQRLIDQHRSWMQLEGEAIYVHSRVIGGTLQRAVWNPCDRPVRLALDDDSTIELGAGQMEILSAAAGASAHQEVSGALKHTLQWIGPWTVTPQQSNTLCLGEWQWKAPDGKEQLMKVPAVTGGFPQTPPGGTAVLETTFELDALIENLRLNWDRLAFAAEARLWINDHPLDLSKASPGELPDSLELPLEGLTHKGSNRIRLSIGPVHTDEAPLGEPLYLCGPFHVVQTAPPRLCPAGIITLPDPRDWTQFGFPHYSGAMTYAASFELPKGIQRVCLEASPDQIDPFEVRVNGQPLGNCCWHPWRIDLSPALRAGRNELKIIVANTLINRIEGKSQPSGLPGRPRLWGE